MGDAPLATIDSVTKHFASRRRPGRPAGTVRAVNGVTLNIGEGETLGVVGESGCGKSTLARLIMGLLPVTAGNISYRGVPVDGRGAGAFKGRVQMIFQDPYSSLDPRMSVRRSIEEPLRIHTRLSRREKLTAVKEALESVSMSEDVLRKHPHEFSGGQRQRLGIARALVLKPEFVVCDEPVSALDVSVQAQVLNLFKSLQREYNLTYFFVSHDLGVVHHMSDRIAVMYLGELVELAPRQEFFANTLHPYSRALLEAVPRVSAEPGSALRPIKGEIPNPLNPPPGCPFQTRCPAVMPICRTEKPELVSVRPGHLAACHAIDAGRAA